MARRIITCIFPLNYHYAVKVAEGVAAYVAQHPHLGLQIPGRFGFMPMVSIQEFQSDGVVGFFSSPEEAESFRSRGMLVVNASGFTDRVRPWVHLNDRRIGELGADSLCAHGFRHFLYVGFSDMNDNVEDEGMFSRSRFSGFQDRLRQSGFGCRSLRLKRWSFYQLPGWTRGLRQLSKALAEAPRPLGVFCVNDSAASLVTIACRQAGLRIPEEVGLVGTDNDPLACHGVDPSLSSIEIDSTRIGWEAARILDESFAGKDRTATEICLDPVELVERGSLGLLQKADPRIAEAIRLMRNSLTDNSLVATLPARLGMSRRSFERHFREAVSRSPAQEMLALRLQRVQQELLKGSKSLKEIAETCGFGDAGHLQKAFRSRFGIPPGAWREQNRRG